MSLEKEFPPFTEASELKHIGFDEPCFGWYDGEYKDIVNYDRTRNSCGWLNDSSCSAPTFSQAFRWFRENHQLPCWVYTSDNKEYWYSVLKNGRMIVRDYKPFQSYEEAELACLRKLIILVK